MYIGLHVKYLLLLERRADRRDEANSRFLQFCECTQKLKRKMLVLFWIMSRDRSYPSG